jgi:UDP-N-acetylglucosamine 2-epimerase (non-hydrolysing)
VGALASASIPGRRRVRSLRHGVVVLQTSAVASQGSSPWPKRVAVIIGTRPEAIKLAPVIHRLGHSSKLSPVVVATAQHRGLLDLAFEDLDIQADVDLDLMIPRQTLAGFASRCFSALDEAMGQLKPDVIVIQGDTTTVMVAGIVGFYRRVPVCHVEAGLRSFDLGSPFPEEMHRVVVGQLADLHFAPTSAAHDNLLREGVRPERVIITGNTVIDALLEMVGRIGPASFDEADSTYILMTLHRRDNFGEPARRVCEALGILLAKYPSLHLVWPVHPNPNIHDIAHEYFSDHPRVLLAEPFGYRRFVEEMLRARLILSDSGGVQEEAPALGRPVLVLRETTERGEALKTGGAQLIGTGRDAVIDAVTRLLEDEEMYGRMSQPSLPYGDGHASERIVQALEARYA